MDTRSDDEVRPRGAWGVPVLVELLVLGFALVVAAALAGFVASRWVLVGVGVITVGLSGVMADTFNRMPFVLHLPRRIQQAWIVLLGLTAIIVGLSGGAGLGSAR